MVTIYSLRAIALLNKRSKRKKSLNPKVGIWFPQLLQNSTRAILVANLVAIVSLNCVAINIKLAKQSEDAIMTHA